MDAKDIAQLVRDEHGHFLRIEHDGEIYYAHHGLKDHMNSIFDDMFSCVYVSIHSACDNTFDEWSSMPCDMSQLASLSFTRNIIAEKFNGRRIHFQQSDFGGAGLTLE